MTAASSVITDEDEYYEDGDPLGAARGMMWGVALSVAFFWLPAALFIMWRFHV